MNEQINELPQDQGVDAAEAREVSAAIKQLVSPAVKGEATTEAQATEQRVTL